MTERYLALGSRGSRPRGLTMLVSTGRMYSVECIILLPNHISQHFGVTNSFMRVGHVDNDLVTKLRIE